MIGFIFFPTNAISGIGQRDEAPVRTPGIVEDVEDGPRFRIEPADIDLAQVDARILHAAGDDARDDWREPAAHIEIVGVEVLDAAITRRLDPAFIGRAVVTHHHHRRVVEPLDQQARLVPNT
jgi:hypothetical protein